MSCTEAKIAANQANAKLSTGPKTEEGKETSRRNALRHGMSGAGKALPPDVEADFNQRLGEWVQKYQPQGDEESTLVRQIALAATRMHHLPTLIARLEASHRNRDLACWDLDRNLSAGRLITRLAVDPMNVINELRLSSHGVSALIEYWRALRAGLAGEGECRWSDADLSLAIELLGVAPAIRHLHPEASSWRELVSAARAGDHQAVQALQEKADAKLDELEHHAEALRTRVETPDFEDLEQGYRLDTHRSTVSLRRLETAAVRLYFRCIRRLEALQADRKPSSAPAAAAPRSRSSSAISRLGPLLESDPTAREWRKPPQEGAARDEVNDDLDSYSDSELEAEIMKLEANLPPHLRVFSRRAQS